MKIAIVILNWNGSKYLRQFLPSVISHSENAEIIVADNASTDDSCKLIEQEFPGVRLIRLSDNYGFCKGYNIALKEIKSEYYILLNSDIEVVNGWLNPLIKFMDENANVAACQPKILSYQQKDYFEYAGAAGGFIDILGYPFCRGRIFNSLEKDFGQYDKMEEVFWATGACLVIRSEIFHQTGGFDEDFFAHMEEIDLCWRIKAIGHQIFCVPESKVYHVGGGTLSVANPHKTYLNFRNNLVLILKNYPGKKVAYVFFIRLLLDGIAGIKFLFNDGISHCWAIIKAHFWVYANFSKTLQKRKSIRKFSYNELRKSPGILNKSLIFLYYFKKVIFFSDIWNKN